MHRLRFMLPTIGIALLALLISRQRGGRARRHDRVVRWYVLPVRHLLQLRLHLADTRQSRCDGDTYGCFRPHVVYDAATGMYVLWVNVHDNGVDYRVFTDDDGTAYIVYTDWHTGDGDLIVEQLDSSDLSGTGTYTRLGQSGTETLAMFKRDGVYYLTYSDPACGYCSGTGHHQGEAEALANLGTVRRLAGDPAGAQDDLGQALEIYHATGHPGDEAWALNHHAAAIAADGDLPHALALYHHALTVNRELNKPDSQATALEGLGECHLASGETETAAAHLRQALEIYKRLGMAPDAERVRTRLADLTAS